LVTSLASLVIKQLHNKNEISFDECLKNIHSSTLSELFKNSIITRFIETNSKNYFLKQLSEKQISQLENEMNVMDKKKLFWTCKNVEIKNHQKVTNFLKSNDVALTYSNFTDKKGAQEFQIKYETSDLDKYSVSMKVATNRRGPCKGRDCEEQNLVSKAT
jgi:small-conductance mechanosensitive channel